MEDYRRTIIFYKRYFLDFYAPLSIKVQDKIDHVLKIIGRTENVPSKFLRHITGTKGLFEARIAHQSDIYRVFCCFDEGKLVILFNGFQKKTQKTPKKEIDLATKLKEEYFNAKKQ